MEAFEAILGRVTTPPAKMGEPGPDDAALRRMVEAAAAAPDHGKLEPFRFIAVRGAARERLGGLLADAARLELHDPSEAEVRKQAEAPTRAPLLLIAVARLRPDHPKVPVVEQQHAAACAVQNLLLAAHALGFAAKWATGFPAASPAVKQGLGLAAHEEIAAFLYLGTAKARQSPPPRPAPEAILTAWTG